jgi:hypothetical protein
LPIADSILKENFFTQVEAKRFTSGVVVVEAGSKKIFIPVQKTLAALLRKF